MAWDFETDPEFQKKLDWIEEFMRDEVEPLSHLGMAVFSTLGREKFIKPLQQKVKDQGLWACHLGPELGGQGFGQLKLALMNEKLGRNGLAPSVFGCQAPDSGNAEIIAHYGTEAQKERYLWPLLNGEIRSAFSMSEPSGGSDPLTFTTRAVLDGKEWVINGEKWFSTNARNSKVLVLYAVTDPDARSSRACVAVRSTRLPCAMPGPLCCRVASAHKRVPPGFQNQRRHHVDRAGDEGDRGQRAGAPGVEDVVGDHVVHAAKGVAQRDVRDGRHRLAVAAAGEQTQQRRGQARRGGLQIGLHHADLARKARGEPLGNVERRALAQVLHIGLEGEAKADHPLPRRAKGRGLGQDRRAGTIGILSSHLGAIRASWWWLSACSPWVCFIWSWKRWAE